MSTKHISLDEYRKSKLKDYAGVQTVELGTGFITKRTIRGVMKWFTNRNIQVNLTEHQFAILNGTDR